MAEDVSRLPGGEAYKLSRLQAELTQREDELARYRRFAGLLQDCFFEYDLQQRSVTVLEGPDAEKYRRLLRDGSAPPENERMLLDVLEKSREGVDAEFPLLDGKGGTRWFHVRLRALRDEAGRRTALYGSFRDIQAQKDREYHRAVYEDRLRQRSVSDAITGLLNRGTTEEVVNVRLAAASGKNVCILADVDDFKLVNDTHGHVFGDMVLREISEVFRTSCRSNDVAGRIGGDEFFLMLCSVPDVFDARTRLKSIVDKVYALTGKLGVKQRVSVSIGAVIAGPEDRDFATVYARADQALYRAKRMGKNTACLVE